MDMKIKIKTKIVEVIVGMSEPRVQYYTAHARALQVVKWKHFRIQPLHKNSMNSFVVVAAAAAEITQHFQRLIYFSNNIRRLA